MRTLKRPKGVPSSNLNQAPGRRAAAGQLPSAQPRLETPAGQLPPSDVVDLLPPERVVELQSVPIDAKITWMDFELAREKGFDVPATNTLTPEFERAVLDTVAFRAVPRGKEDPGATGPAMFADMYSGTGMSPDKIGSGRAAFLPWGNMYAKGFVTGLNKTNDPLSFQHSHGGLSMEEACYEAIWGGVYTDLLSTGSSRVLCILDNGEHTIWPDGSYEKRAIAIRVDDDVRPGHLIESWGYAGGPYSAPLFERATRANGDLALRRHKGELVPDYRATLSRLLQKHARATAEQVRFRLLHGALSTSNLLLSARQVDLATSTSQARTAPIKSLGHTEPFGTEHLRRAQELGGAYDGVIEQLSQAERTSLNARHASYPELKAEMTKAYAAALSLEVAKATGLKSSLVEELAQHEQPILTELRKAFEALARLSNDGPVLADKVELTGLSVVDVFNFFRKFPAYLFAHPDGDHLEHARTLLALDERTVQVPPGAIERLVTAYKHLIQAAGKRGEAHYESVEQMRRSIVARAEVENTPLPHLVRPVLKQRINDAVALYQHTGDDRVLRELIDDARASSHRNVESLLRQGRRRPLPGDGAELQRKTIDGVTYAVRAQGDKRWLRVSLVVRGNDEEGYRLDGHVGAEHFSRQDLERLELHHGLDGEWTDTRAQLHANARGRVRALHFEVPLDASKLTGSIQGLFRLPNDHGESRWVRQGGHRDFQGYTFAIPDNQELKELLAS